MARLQQKRTGYRKPRVEIDIQPREFKAKSEEYLAEKGLPSKRWGDYRGKGRKRDKPENSN